MADEFSDKLNAVLGNPDAMGQILSLARTLTGDSESATDEVVEQVEATPVSMPSSLPDFSGIMGMVSNLMGGGGQSSGGGTDPFSMLSNLDPRLIQAGIHIFSEYNGQDDRKVALLLALKPFLKEERAAKLERAAQAAKLARVVRVVFQMFKEGGGGSDV